MDCLNSLIVVLRVTREHRRIALINNTVLSYARRALHANYVWQLRELQYIVEHICAASALDQNFNRARLATAETITNYVVGNHSSALLRQNSVVNLAELNVARQRHQPAETNEGHERYSQRALHHEAGGRAPEARILALGLTATQLELVNAVTKNGQHRRQGD